MEAGHVVLMQLLASAAQTTFSFMRVKDSGEVAVKSAPCGVLAC